MGCQRRHMGWAETAGGLVEYPLQFAQPCMPGPGHDVPPAYRRHGPMLVYIVCFVNDAFRPSSGT